ncbi:cytochrome c-type biogenesis protein CcmH [Caldichromatium japonicum]|uniref:Cytochrome c-type biogenesis protein n=1 Tax=Caldichromatium japonicum TaxID=2699430 RepID=A0A6G7VF37_9GAMM|nr:cytochrome c-type biogenesis protein [Caldichromatium japonicum]QIK38468.1 cytochrome c-type biogenesis protein CcmH [Caldichromatium japonicum]
MNRCVLKTASIVLCLTGILLARPALAYTLEEFRFDDPKRGAEFRDLIAELRCVVCQNESLAGSQASVAQDLRREIYRRMQEGQTREQIIDFLVARYGEFILYDPPLKPSTVLIWLGPLVLVGAGGYLFIRTLKRKQTEPEPDDLTEEERTRLYQLLPQAEPGQKVCKG